MGEVWLAEQSAPVKRQVALKIIKAGRYDKSALIRFDLERQALAMMDHPVIAKVFEAGSTAEGQPYFAMEYVIEQVFWCDTLGPA
jgi:non-specific serine/threonine protein kinase/serine/threonine-protein kinase